MLPHYLSFNVHALLAICPKIASFAKRSALLNRQLIYITTLLNLCQPLFLLFFKFFLSLCIMPTNSTFYFINIDTMPIQIGTTIAIAVTRHIILTAFLLNIFTS